MHQSTTWTVKTTTDAFADIGPAFRKMGSRSFTVVVRNTGGANVAKVQLMGSVDGTNYVNIGTVTTVAASTAVALPSVTDYWPWVKLQIAANVAAAQTTVVADVAAIGVG